MRSIKPHTKKQNKGERVIEELRQWLRDKRRQTNMPQRVWDYALVWCTEILSRTHNPKSGRTGIERLTGDTPDVSEWIDFDLYDRVWFWDAPGRVENPKPGRWLGVSHWISGALCYWVVDSLGHIFSRTMVLNNHDTTDIRKQKFIGTRKHNPEARKASHEYVGKDSDGSTKDVSIKNIHGTSLHTMGGDKGSIGGDDAKEKRRDEMSGVVEPRSYRDVLMNGKERQTMT